MMFQRKRFGESSKVMERAEWTSLLYNEVWFVHHRHTVNLRPNRRIIEKGLCHPIRAGITNANTVADAWKHQIKGVSQRLRRDITPTRWRNRIVLTRQN